MPSPNGSRDYRTSQGLLTLIESLLPAIQFSMNKAEEGEPFVNKTTDNANAVKRKMGPGPSG